MNFGYAHKFIGHKDTLLLLYINQETINPKLMSCSLDGNIIFWDIKLKRMISKSQITNSTNQEISTYSIDSGIIFVGYSEGLISSYDLSNLNQLVSYKGHNDQITAITCSNSSFFSSSQENFV